MIEVIVERLNPDGSVKSTDVVRRHTILSEAEITARNMRRSHRELGKSESEVRVVIRGA